MALEHDHYCPCCGAERSFYRTASTHLHLGLKTKWACPDCSYRFALIDDEIETGSSA